MSFQFLFWQAPRLDSFYLQILWSTVRGSPVSRLHLSLEPLAAGCWSHHQYTKYKYNANRESFCMFTGVALEDGELVRRQLGLTAAAVCITCRCLCSVPCLQSTLVLAAGVARDCQPGRRGPSIRRDIICCADTLTSRGHTRATWPYTWHVAWQKDMHTLKVLPHEQVPEDWVWCWLCRGEGEVSRCQSAARHGELQIVTI